jgi:hypothetical protein
MEDPVSNSDTRIVKKAPEALIDRHKADEVLEIAVKLVRMQQSYLYSQDRAMLKKARPLIAALRLHFPSLSRGEVLRLANVLVHIGSLALRHALGMAVVLPGTKEHLESAIKISRDEQGRRLNVRLEDGTLITLEDALLRLFREHSRLTAIEVLSQMEERGWAYLFRGKNPSASVRECLRKCPLFREIEKRPGSRTVVFRLAR